MNRSPPPSRSLLRNAIEAAVAALLVVVFVVTTVGISGDSMLPTLHDGERALVPRIETWLHRLGWGRFGRGAIVYFPSPEEDGRLCPLLCTHLIKRVVALGGDTVALDNGTLVVNGVALDERYLGSGWHGSSSMSEVRVPLGSVFVLGDNRGPFGSLDSRAYGPVPVASLEGRAALVFWPPLRRDEEGRLRLNLRRLSPPAAFDALEAAGRR